MENVTNPVKPEDCEPSYAEMLNSADVDDLPEAAEASFDRLSSMGIRTPVVDWPKELNKMKIDWRKLLALAREWVSCACGNQCSIIPRDSNGEPEDPTLKRLGMNFMNAIDYRDKKGAKQILKDIEVRAIELITDIYSQRDGKPGK